MNQKTAKKIRKLVRKDINQVKTSVAVGVWEQLLNRRPAFVPVFIWKKMLAWLLS